MNAAHARTGIARQLLAEDVWWNTPGLAQLLGLCPLLAASRTPAGGLALGLASLAVLCASNVLSATLGHRLAPRFRQAGALLLIGALVTAVDLFFQAWWFGLRGEVGLFVPLIATNCVIQARSTGFAATGKLRHAFLDGLGTGAGFTVLLVALGALRDLLTPGLLVAGLPAGAFFLLAGLVALRHLVLRRRGGP